jgi:hypothetical protein
MPGSPSLAASMALQWGWQSPRPSTIRRTEGSSRMFVDASQVTAARSVSRPSRQAGHPG